MIWCEVPEGGGGGGGGGKRRVQRKGKRKRGVEDYW